jgi:hypothetical protein
MFIGATTYGVDIFFNMQGAKYDACKTDTFSPGTNHADLFRVTTAMMWVTLVLPGIVFLTYAYLTLRWCGCIGKPSAQEAAAPTEHAYAPVATKEQ